MSSLSRRKLASTEDFLKLLSDQIRDEKMRNQGSAANRGATLDLFPIMDADIYLSDTLTSASTNQLDNTITLGDVNTVSSKNTGTYVIGTAQIGYSDIG